MDHSTIHLAHLLVMGPILFIIGTGFFESWFPDYLVAIAILGALILAYHVSRIYAKYRTGQPSWSNFIHVLVVAPVLIGYGVTGERWLREIVLMLAFAAIGWHGYQVVAVDHR